MPKVRRATTVKVLLSPSLQDGIEDFAVGTTEVPPLARAPVTTTRTPPRCGCSLPAASGAILGGRDCPAGPGTVVFTPPGTFHQVINTRDEPVKLYCTSSAE